MLKFSKITVAILILASLVLASCSGANAEKEDDGETVTLTLAAYSTPREVYAELIPIFVKQYKEKTGITVKFEESYEGSGAQSRAVLGGFEADIVAFSLEAHVTALVDAGLITHDWKAEYNGSISNSVVVLAVRPNNPKDIHDWADITKDGVDVITPDPATSGGAQWNILAAYGAAIRGHVDGYNGDDEGATDFLIGVIKNVLVFDKDARESYLNFENGVGDVAITYENEVFAAKKSGGQVEAIYPTSTILIENPIALVDQYVDKHDNREAAEAFIDFLQSPEAQRIYAKHGYRPILSEVATEEKIAAQFPAIEDLFIITEQFESWGVVGAELFGTDGRFTKLIADTRAK
jgi:sulfate/thiosulfate transport system substrate-binding protein